MIRPNHRQVYFDIESSAQISHLDIIISDIKNKIRHLDIKLWLIYH